MNNNLDMICAMIIYRKTDITNLVLQKLLYFIQAYSLVYNKHRAFEENIEAWMYGPVVPVVYSNFKNNPNAYRGVDFTLLPEDTKQAVDDVVSNLADLNPYFLVERTHQYRPWIEAWDRGRKSSIIKWEEIETYHRERLEREGSAF